jgi:hypothetical protein
MDGKTIKHRLSRSVHFNLFQTSLIAMCVRNATWMNARSHCITIRMGVSAKEFSVFVT